MKKVLLFILICCIAVPAWGTDYATRFATNTALSVITPTSGDAAYVRRDGTTTLTANWPVGSYSLIFNNNTGIYGVTAGNLLVQSGNAGTSSGAAGQILITGGDGSATGVTAGGDIIIEGGAGVSGGAGGDIIIRGDQIGTPGNFVIEDGVDWTGITGNIDIGSNDFDTTGTIEAGSTFIAEIGGQSFGGNTYAGIFRASSDTQGVLLGGNTFAFQDLSGQSWIDNAGQSNFDSSMTTLTAYIGNMTITSGSITDSSGTINFGNENLVTTGDVDIGGTGSGKLYVTDGTMTSEFLDGSYWAEVFTGAANSYGLYMTRTGGDYIVLFDGTNVAQFNDGSNAVYLFDGTYSLNVQGGNSQFAGDVSVQGDLFITQDNKKVAWGAAGASDGYIQFGGANLEAYSAGNTVFLDGNVAVVNAHRFDIGGVGDTLIGYMQSIGGVFSFTSDNDRSINIGPSGDTDLIHINGATDQVLVDAADFLTSSDKLIVGSGMGVHRASDNATEAANVACVRAGGTLASPTVVADTYETGRFLFGGWDGDQTINSARIGGIVDGAVSDNVVPQGLTFKTGTTSTPTIALSIDSSQDIHVPADDKKITWGAAGATDSYIQWDGSGLDRYSSGGIFNFQAAANTDITLNFEGTTSSGVMKWMEDEDYFSFDDKIFQNINLDVEVAGQFAADFQMTNINVGGATACYSVRYKTTSFHSSGTQYELGSLRIDSTHYSANPITNFYGVRAQSEAWNTAGRGNITNLNLVASDTNYGASCDFTVDTHSSFRSYPRTGGAFITAMNGFMALTPTGSNIGTYSAIFIQDSTAATTNRGIVIDSDTLGINLADDQSVVLVGTTGLLTVTGNIATLGNVGIGVSADASIKLDISGTTDIVRITTSAAGGDFLDMIGDNGDPVFEFDSAGTGGEAHFKMYKDNDLKVNINTNAAANIADFTTLVGTFGTTTDGITLNDGSSAFHVYGTDTTEYGIVDTGINFDLVALPSKPAADLIEVAGNVDAGLHYYYVEYITNFGGTGIDDSNPKTSVTTDGTHEQVDVTIPVSPDYRVIARKIYRTKADESSWKEYLLATINDNTTTTYIDNISDATINAGGLVYAYTQSNTSANILLIDGINAVTIGDSATRIGDNAGLSGNGVVIGSYAGTNLTASALGNVLIGHQAGLSLTTGGGNVLIGYDAGRSIATTASNNMAMGQLALYDAGGSHSIGIGYRTGIYAEGTGNTLVGSQAGFGVSGGSNGTYNACYGYQSGYRLIDGGGHNSFFGSYSGDDVTSGSYNIAIGDNINPDSVTADYQLNIGNLIKGDMTAGSETLSFVNPTAATAQTTRWFTTAGDGTDDNSLIIYGTGTLADQTNSESLNIGFYNSDTAEIFTQDTGTGDPKPIYIYTDVVGQTYTQIGCLIDGSTKIGNADEANNTIFATDGTQTMEGTARVTKEVELNAGAISAGASGVTLNADYLPYIGYEFGIGDNMYAQFEIPHDWDITTDIVVKLYWAINEARTGDNEEVQWTVDWKACPSGDSEAIDAPTHTGNIDYGDQLIPTNAKYLTKTGSGTIAVASLTEGDLVGLDINRIALDGGNSPTNEPILYRVEIEYTSDRIGEDIT